MILKPQPGPQELFLSTRADIAIYGGAAGGGKSFGMLLEPLRHVLRNKQFSATFFRRTTVQVRNPGGLWDESLPIYGALGGEPLVSPLEWRFSGGGKIKFAHLEHEHSVLDWQGSQLPLILFDELTHFTASQFWYMLSRNRSTCGVKPYVRASCNPDADSWVAQLIDWWIDKNTGLPIPERSGVLRWFHRDGDRLIWGDSPADLEPRYTPDGERIQPKSLTFIAAKLTDNKLLMSKDPGYYANLAALPMVERERLLNGNWRIRPAAGMYFRRDWIQIIDALPAGLQHARGWDIAATEKTDSNDPDFTVGIGMSLAPDRRIYVWDARWLQGTPGAVKRFITNTASQDGYSVLISMPQDPGQAGKYQAADYSHDLVGYNFHATTESRNAGVDQHSPSRVSAKISRFSPFSAQCEAGNVYFLRGDWNERLMDELEGFPEAKHDDSADATSRAFGALIESPGLPYFDDQLLRAI